MYKRQAQNRALNIGISGDRTEHLLFRLLPKSLGGLGHLDADALAPEFFVLMVGINNSYAAEPPDLGAPVVPAELALARMQPGIEVEGGACAVAAQQRH